MYIINYNDLVSPEGSVQVMPTFINGRQGGTAQFTCNTTGGPGNQFTWRRVSTNTIVSTGSILILSRLNVSSGGDYQCSVENLAGRENATVTLNGINNSSQILIA